MDSIPVGDPDFFSLSPGDLKNMTENPTSYLWNLPSSNDFYHEFLRYRLKILAHDDVVVVRFTNNESKAEILKEKKNSTLLFIRIAPRGSCNSTTLSF